MGLTKPYRRLRNMLHQTLEAISQFARKETLTLTAESRLKRHLWELVRTVDRYLETYRGRKKPSFDSIPKAVEDFRRRFGHEPGFIIRGYDHKYQWTPVCVDHAQTKNFLLQHLLGADLSKGTLVIQGVGQSHIGTTLKIAGGREFFLQPAGLESTAVQSVDEFKAGLKDAIFDGMHPMHATAASLGLLYLRDPKAYLNDPRVFIHSGPQAIEAGIYENMGVLYQLIGDFKTAAQYFRRTIALLPELADAHNSLGEVEIKLGNHEAAMDHFQEAVRRVPVHVEAEFNLSNAYSELKNQPKSLDHARRWNTAATDVTVPYLLQSRRRIQRIKKE